MPQILLVEDNEMNRDMLSRRLNRKGYEVLMAVDGDECMQVLSEHKPDLVEIYDASVQTHGGGWMRIDPVNKSIKIYGRSTAYGTYDREVVTEVISNHQEYSEFSLQLPQV